MADPASEGGPMVQPCRPSRNHERRDTGVRQWPQQAEEGPPHMGATCLGQELLVGPEDLEQRNAREGEEHGDGEISHWEILGTPP